MQGVYEIKLLGDAGVLLKAAMMDHGSFRWAAPQGPAPVVEIEVTWIPVPEEPRSS